MLNPFGQGLKLVEKHVKENLSRVQRPLARIIYYFEFVYFLRYFDTEFSVIVTKKFICFREKAGNITLFPWPSPHSKWRVGERLQITPRIVKYFVTRTHDEMAFSEVVFSVRQPCFVFL